MVASNYDDVLAQLHAGGLVGRGIDDGLRIGTTKPVRCKTDEGGREQRGWYRLNEWQAPWGELLITGSYGIWRGNEQNTTKIELPKGDRKRMTPDHMAALKKNWAEDRKRADRMRDAEAARAAEAARKAWLNCAPTGDSDYLASKGVGAHGLRFSPSGAVAIPMLDTTGKIHGLQIIRTSAGAKAQQRPAKEYWPAGLAKKGHFHLLGAPSTMVLVAEGYATAASLFEATGIPTAAAFDANNLPPVAEALHKRYAGAKILICADDDIAQKCDACKVRLHVDTDPVTCAACGEPHRRGNAGISSASAAALAVAGHFTAPRFSDDAARRDGFIQHGRKLSDFNDLHAAEGLHVVRQQIEATLGTLGWNTVPRAASSTTSGGGEATKLVPIESFEELLERFALVYAHSGAVFDRKEHLLLSISDMREACVNKYIHRAWSESPMRDIVRIREVGFDPTGNDPDITCNLYAGWPTTPKAGNCDRLLDLLRYMCSKEKNPQAVFEWVLKWVAYPIQNPGAKMKTSIVVHGPAGTGKNMFFESVMRIYGEYADVLDQSAVEDKFNDWASRKLFMIADEVVARSDVYHIKNKLKGLITGDRIRINPKNFAAYFERNHMNMVFLSNEAMPVVLEEDDRRYCVVWTPSKMPEDYYHALKAEQAAGGDAALHDYLLKLDLTGFTNATNPPKTAAKDQLIELGQDSPIRFHDDLLTDDIPNVSPMPALASDWYQMYRLWCKQHGYHTAPLAKFVVALVRNRNVEQGRKRYQPAGDVKGPHSFLMMGLNRPPDPSVTELLWLGDCHCKFQEQLTAYREAVSPARARP